MSQNIEENRKTWPKASDNFTVGQKEVNNEKIWEPPSDYEKGGQYGKVHGRTFRSGHSIEIDETEGGKRIRIVHANGSYVEMQDDGTTIYRSNKDDYEVICGDKNVRVGGSVNVFVSGDANIKVGGSTAIETGSDLTLNVGGNVKIDASTFEVNSSTFKHNGKNVGETHVHSGVEPGGGTSGAPV